MEAKGKFLPKRHIIKQVSKETGLPVVQIEFIYEVLVDTIKEKIKEGHNVNIVGLAAFVLKDSPHAGKPSNLTGEPIPPHKILKATVSQRLKKEVNLLTRT